MPGAGADREGGFLLVGGDVMTPKEAKTLRIKIRREYREKMVPVRAWFDAELKGVQAECDHEWEPFPHHDYSGKWEICNGCDKVRKVQ